MTVRTVGVCCGHQLQNNYWINSPVPNKRILFIFFSRRYDITVKDRQIDKQVLPIKSSLQYVKTPQVYVMFSLIIYKHEVVHESVFQSCEVWFVPLAEELNWQLGKQNFLNLFILVSMKRTLNFQKGVKFRVSCQFSTIITMALILGKVNQTE